MLCVIGAVGLVFYGHHGRNIGFGAFLLLNAVKTVESAFFYFTNLNTSIKVGKILKQGNNNGVSGILSNYGC